MPRHAVAIEHSSIVISRLSGEGAADIRARSHQHATRISCSGVASASRSRLWWIPLWLSLSRVPALPQESSYSTQGPNEHHHRLLPLSSSSWHHMPINRLSKHPQHRLIVFCLRCRLPRVANLPGWSGDLPGWPTAQEAAPTAVFSPALS